MKIKSFLFIPILLLSNISSASIHERSWDFKVDEVVFYDFKNYNTGINVGCEKFDNGKVSFEIKYKNINPFINNNKISTDVVDGNGFYTITLNDISELDLAFPAGGEYYIKNISGYDVKSKHCDTGII
ncbi:hypothetical protein [Fluviispira multicolorata]|uniref:Uncharacterized protein n=1 Tax=Fluviispira multicolorata TaxID=2654512 RepID=A0A833JED6_9BACT|nr:hypothetical protein [Fluviispira multicolorata]KAB8029885.1 hypothetical protein GCL57_10130 [Fluviispira multicolorata]